MSPKEKAEELILKFMRLQEPNYNWFHSKLAKQCALISVDELIKEQTMWQNGEVNPVLYWQEVKQEIEKL
jgi:nitrogenase molybdenum-iron protein alpha/beta subunit